MCQLADTALFKRQLKTVYCFTRRSVINAMNSLVMPLPLIGGTLSDDAV